MTRENIFKMVKNVILLKHCCFFWINPMNSSFILYTKHSGNDRYLKGHVFYFLFQYFYKTLTQQSINKYIFYKNQQVFIKDEIHVNNTSVTVSWNRKNVNFLNWKGLKQGCIIRLLRLDALQCTNNVFF